MHGDDHFRISFVPAKSILEQALALVRGERRAAYGPPQDNHGATARMFAVYLERKHGVRVDIDAADVCVFNILQKLSRDAHAPKRDNLRDIAGYIANLDEIRGGEA